MKQAILLAALAIVAGAALAEGSAEAGKEKSIACATCHGADGKSGMASFPKLAGQNAAYLVYALKTYRAGQRKGSQAGLMMPVAAGLSDQDIEDLAAYYASLAP